MKPSTIPIPRNKYLDSIILQRGKRIVTRRSTVSCERAAEKSFRNMFTKVSKKSTKPFFLGCRRKSTTVKDRDATAGNQHLIQPNNEKTSNASVSDKLIEIEAPTPRDTAGIRNVVDMAVFFGPTEEPTQHDTAGNDLLDMDGFCGPIEAPTQPDTIDSHDVLSMAGFSGINANSSMCLVDCMPFSEQERPKEPKRPPLRPIPNLLKISDIANLKKPNKCESLNPKQTIAAKIGGSVVDCMPKMYGPERPKEPECPPLRPIPSLLKMSDTANLKQPNKWKSLNPKQTIAAKITIESLKSFELLLKPTHDHALCDDPIDSQGEYFGKMSYLADSE